VAVVAEGLQRGGLVTHRRVHDVHEHDGGVFLARVVAAFVDGEVQQVRRLDLQATEDGLPERLFRMVQRQRELRDSDHKRFLAGGSGRGSVGQKV
jgi:hypothetical protein